MSYLGLLSRCTANFGDRRTAPFAAATAAVIPAAKAAAEPERDIPTEQASTPFYLERRRLAAEDVDGPVMRGTGCGMPVWRAAAVYASLAAPAVSPYQPGICIWQAGDAHTICGRAWT